MVYLISPDLLESKNKSKKHPKTTTFSYNTSTTIWDCKTATTCGHPFFHPPPSPPPPPPSLVVTKSWRRNSLTQQQQQQQQKPNKEKRSKFWLVPSSHIRNQKTQNTQVCRNQQRKAPNFGKVPKDIRIKTQNTQVCRNGEEKQKTRRRRRRHEKGGNLSPYLQNRNKTWTTNKTHKILAKDSGKQKEKVLQSFSLSEITIFLLSVSLCLSFFLSFAWWPLMISFWVWERKREREREEREGDEWEEG